MPPRWISRRSSVAWSPSPLTDIRPCGFAPGDDASRRETGASSCWVVIAGLAAGIAHLVTAVGLIRLPSAASRGAYIRLRHPDECTGDFRPMVRAEAGAQDAGMDAMSMVLLAIGSLACLEIAAVNLRGDVRRPRNARAARPRRHPASHH